ncbi:hypothetical protein Tco_0283195 [Tanacetum coccineum]
MTRSSTKELFIPLDNPKRVFRLKRRLFETPSLEGSNSPESNQFYDIEERSKEEATEAMMKAMEQYMSKTRGDYKLGVTTPKIDGNAHFELKGQFHKELRDNTFSGSNLEDANEHIEKVLEIILDLKGAIPTMTAANAKVAIQQMAEYSQKWHDGTSTKTRSTETSEGLAAIQAQLNNLRREIKKVNEKDKDDFERENIAGTLIDIPIFVGNFSLVTGFAVVDDMDIYCKDRAAIRCILGFGIRRPCCNEIDNLVKVYSRIKRVLYSYGHSDASTTNFCSRTQSGESSRAECQGSSSF